MKPNQVLVDYKKADYRAFIFVVHENYGLLLLHCTRKKNKPPHFQLPGGHVDEAEFAEAALHCTDAKSQLLFASKCGSARELFEETGMDVRSQLDRLEPANLRNPQVETDKLVNEYKQRLFYFLKVTDNDFKKIGESPMGTEGRQLKLKLSHEHSGFKFEPEPTQAAELLKYHSGGKSAEALLMAMRQGETSATPLATTPAVVEATPLKSTVEKSLSSESMTTSRRRSKREKDASLRLPKSAPVELFPPQKKSEKHCWGFCPLGG